MKKGLTILVALSIALLMGASMLVAQEKAAVEKEKASCQKEMQVAGKEMGSCGKEMKLTDEQKAKLEEIMMNFRLKMIDLKAEREKLGITLKKEMMKPEPVMQDIEGIVKKMSAVREKIQMAGIECKLACRKLLGPEACKGMPGGMGSMRGMSCGGEEKDCLMMCEPGSGAGEECGMPVKRMMKMRMEAPGCGMEKGEGCGAEGMKGCGSGAMKAGCAMEKGAPGAGGCEGDVKTDCKIIVKKCEGRSPRMYGNWHHKMFRPFGKNEPCSMKMSCGTKKGAEGACSDKGGMKCGMQGAKGGCMMGKEAAAGCAKEGAKKEIECKIEVREIKEESKKE
jgi:hypothetical protein